VARVSIAIFLSILNPYTMASMLATILTILITARAALALGRAHSNPVATLWTFPNETWIENLAVRANGHVLCTSLNRNAIYKVNPFDHITETLHQFSSTDGCLGIAETASDVFVIVTANVSLKTNTAWPGSAKIWRVDVRAWELVSRIRTCVNSKQC
jgi:streptogramin lyase